MSFYREQKIRATRKPHRCEGCTRKIGTGLSAIYLAGMWEGDFYASHYHPDCREAEIALNNLHDWRNGDDWELLQGIDDEDRPWLAEEWPAVFARMFPTPSGEGK